MHLKSGNCVMNTKRTNYDVFHCRGGAAESAIMAAGPYNYSYIFKYIIIGDMGVGKSCLLHQFTEKKCKKSLFCIVFSFFLKKCKESIICIVFSFFRLPKDTFRECL